MKIIRNNELTKALQMKYNGNIDSCKAQGN